MSRRQSSNNKLRSKTHAEPSVSSYSAFDEIDGRHPWQEIVPEGCLLYPVRQLKKGRILYFNFALAKEMGLIPVTHADQINPALEKKLLDTFAVQIINEYDQATRKKFTPQDIKPHRFMATRYLQLQHSNKQGKTSGDGRSVWNGSISHNGKRWDVSSRGTGVTQLAPGAVEAKRPLRTGDVEFGYGCGQADIDELFASALMSEVVHGQGLGTERMLCIVDLGRGTGIGVRAAPNLIRPAHLFLYLKQNRHAELVRSTQYLIERQAENKNWPISSKDPARFAKALRYFAEDFARFAADLERNYIFAWLDWDGDNVLASGGIIDYGSVRQFGMRHDQYRYDDVERFSTNLNEQKEKARLTVQVFAQMVDFIHHGRKRPLHDFRTSPALDHFDKSFELRLREQFLRQVGFPESQIQMLLRKHGRKVESLFQTFLVLEKQKTRSPMRRVADGVNRPALFNMRTLLRSIPRMLLEEQWKGEKNPLSNRSLLRNMASSYCRKQDLILKPWLDAKLKAFCHAYLHLLRFAHPKGSPWGSQLRLMELRSSLVNFPGRLTGNGAEYVVQEILKALRQGYSVSDVQEAIDLFLAQQTPHLRNRAMNGPTSINSTSGRLFQKLLALAFEHQEDI